MKNAIDITVVLDRSGSMSNIVSDMEGGFDSFIAEQRKQNTDEASVSLYQFDDKYETVYEGVSLANVPKMRLVPRGGTALYDAIGRSIVATGERLGRLDESQRPNKVILLIITDGGENSSIEYKDPNKIKEMIKHQTEVYSWTIVFLGANQDALFTAQTLGINVNNSLTFASNSVGSKAVFDKLSMKTSSYRGMGASAAPGSGTMFMSYGDEDRQEQMDAGAFQGTTQVTVTNVAGQLTPEQVAKLKTISRGTLTAKR
jgi:uncharacterized protein YegL